MTPITTIIYCVFIWRKRPRWLPEPYSTGKHFHILPYSPQTLVEPEVQSFCSIGWDSPAPPHNARVTAQEVTFGYNVGSKDVNQALMLAWQVLLITKTSTQTLFFFFNFRKQYDILVSVQMNGKQGCSSLGLILSFNFVFMWISADIHSSQHSIQSLS